MATVGDKSSVPSGMIQSQSDSSLDGHGCTCAIISFSDKKITFLCVLILSVLFSAARGCFITVMQVVVLW